MPGKNKTIVPPITNERILPFTRESVFRAWSDPALLAQWWGPHGFTNTIHLFDFRPGGVWKLTMHGPDGTDYLNENRFTEIVPPQKIVFEHLEPIHTFTSTAELEDLGRTTRLRLSMLFDLYSEYEKLKDFIAAANEENFDRLEKILPQAK